MSCLRQRRPRGSPCVFVLYGRDWQTIPRHEHSTGPYSFDSLRRQGKLFQQRLVPECSPTRAAAMKKRKNVAHSGRLLFLARGHFGGVLSQETFGAIVTLRSFGAFSPSLYLLFCRYADVGCTLFSLTAPRGVEREKSVHVERSIHPSIHHQR